MQPNWHHSLSLAFVEGLYSEYLKDPTAVSADWRAYFDEQGGREWSGPPTLGPNFPKRSLFNPPGISRQEQAEASAADVQDRADQLIRSYRVRGHLVADIDPLGLPRPPYPELEPAFYGFGPQDLDRKVSARTFHGTGVETLRTVLDRMRSTYCRSIGVQYMHIDDLALKRWLEERMEGTENRLQLSRERQVRIYAKLFDAVLFEEFVQKKFLGAKSFSLEGCESLIPLLDLALERCGEQQVDEVVIGMAHRGRLNVLANVMSKPAADIFREFEDTDPELHMGRGDVKYHKGFSSAHRTPSGHVVHLSLCFNPSHLEFVNPVAMGRVRAKQDRFGDRKGDRGLALLIHGDAAFAGEGIVQESLNLSELAAYRTGGTVHVVVNNQIGFTTGTCDSRSTTYCTDVAKMLQIPIFHVNGEDPEAVAQVVALALDFRAKFKRDVVIDMYGYRRRGHNEGDEPSFTDPLLYQAIARRKPVAEGYLDHLLSLGGITREEAEGIARERRSKLEEDLSRARSKTFVATKDSQGMFWKGYAGASEASVPRVDTGVTPDTAERLLGALARLPDGFRPHPKLERTLELRREMARGTRSLDWAAGEALALASIAATGHRVRMTGQDAERGTFSHRHAVLHDYHDGKRHEIFSDLGPDTAAVYIRNSALSETAVLGFEYGYSLDYPEALVVWEAQFGDFANVAQPIIDQFIVSAEDKWNRLSGLVMLLPHGFEGQGPEHSSARLERFLTLAADENIQIVNPTTPAQIFHVLRRQVLRPWRKPLIVMTPKSLLRHARCVSPLEAFTSGRFQRVLADTKALEASKVRRIVLCSGKVAYDLEDEREKRAANDIAILRLEQLYPITDSDLEAAFAAYPAAAEVVWLQEEPENNGAWRTLYARYGTKLCGRRFRGLSRRASASPATGSPASHRLEQAALLDSAFAHD
ncbi:MAG: 2-oxoglutarate dehydrogenase E1 component [Planctomycetota bacterium]|nr:2-oxoglutarate dehydrogenase E1 component [Planctomycetota bacterium]